MPIHEKAVFKEDDLVSASWYSSTEEVRKAALLTHEAFRCGCWDAKYVSTVSGVDTLPTLWVAGGLGFVARPQKNSAATANEQRGGPSEALDPVSLVVSPIPPTTS
jgi:hypothetical protein